MADSALFSLSDWLQQGPFSLALAPGFFGFYAQLGAIKAIDKV
jgi:hypothetical protein